MIIEKPFLFTKLILHSFSRSWKNETFEGSLTYELNTHKGVVMRKGKKNICYWKVTKFGKIYFASIKIVLLERKQLNASKDQQKRALIGGEKGFSKFIYKLIKWFLLILVNYLPAKFLFLFFAAHFNVGKDWFGWDLQNQTVIFRGKQ